jgi:hypothetical protein
LIRPDFSKELDTVMLWAAFTLAFFGFLWVSEFTYSSTKTFLAVKDVAFIPTIKNPESLHVHIKQSKTDPFRQGTTLAIAKSHSSVCAVIVLREYLLQRNPTNTDEPLFMLQNGEPLTRTILSANLREVLNILGYIENEYTPHSFRIRAATIDFPKSFPGLLWRASLPLWKGLLSLAARQISPVEKSTGDVIVYIEGRSGYIIGYCRRSLTMILYSQALCWTNVYYWSKQSKQCNYNFVEHKNHVKIHKHTFIHLVY